MRVAYRVSYQVLNWENCCPWTAFVDVWTTEFTVRDCTFAKHKLPIIDNCCILWNMSHMISNCRVVDIIGTTGVEKAGVDRQGGAVSVTQQFTCHCTKVALEVVVVCRPVFECRRSNDWPVHHALRVQLCVLHDERETAHRAGPSAIQCTQSLYEMERSRSENATAASSMKHSSHCLVIRYYTMRLDRIC